jgi:hypothetical protein
MYSRISSALIAIALLGACDSNATPPPEGETLDCAIGQGADFAEDCTLEWLGAEWERDFLIHHPDGGFRRFSLNEDATGVIVQDGAEEVEMLDPAPDGSWQFSVSGDRYRIPAPPPPEV